MKNLKLPSLVPSFAVQTLALSGLVASVMFAAKPSQAAIFNVNGTDYDITTVTGSYNSLYNQLQANPWWGNQSLANSASGAVGGSLGLPTFGSFGPLFAFGTSFSTVNAGVSDSSSGVGGLGVDFSSQFTYALGSPVAAAVPEPLTILGSITAAGFGVAFKRKKNKKA